MTQRLVFAGVSDDKTSDFIVDEAVTDTPMSIKKGCTPEEIMACGKRVWPLWLRASTQRAASGGTNEKADCHRRPLFWPRRLG